MAFRRVVYWHLFSSTSRLMTSQEVGALAASSMQMISVLLPKIATSVLLRNGSLMP